LAAPSISAKIGSDHVVVTADSGFLTNGQCGGAQRSKGAEWPVEVTPDAPALDAALDRSANLLDRVRQWTLTESAWQAVSEGSRGLCTALATRHVHDILLALGAIEVLGPSRGPQIVTSAEPVLRLFPMPPLVAQVILDAERAIQDARTDKAS
jgi:hypothetical protein